MRRSALPSVAVALVGVLGGAAGCDGEERECLTIGCAAGLAVDFAQPLVEDGAYRVEILADGAHTACTAALPADGEPWACEGADTGWFRVDGAGALLTLELEASSRPRSVTVTLLRDEAPIVSQAFEPSYRGQKVGNCGLCYRATVSLDTNTR